MWHVRKKLKSLHQPIKSLLSTNLVGVRCSTACLSIRQSVFDRTRAGWSKDAPGMSKNNAFASPTGMSFVQTLGSPRGTPNGGCEIRELPLLIKQTTSSPQLGHNGAHSPKPLSTDKWLHSSPFFDFQDSPGGKRQQSQGAGF